MADASLVKTLTMNTLSMMEAGLEPIRCISDPRRCFSGEDINRVFLSFKSKELSKGYYKQSDPRFQFYILGLLPVIVCMKFVHLLTINKSAIALVIFASTLMLVLGVFFIFLLACFAGRQSKKFPCYAVFLKTSRYVTQNFAVRMCLAVLLLLIVASLPLVTLKACKDETTVVQTADNATNMGYEFIVQKEKILFEFYLLECLMASTACAVFIHVHFLLKALIMVIGITAYHVVFHLSLLKDVSGLWTYTNNETYHTQFPVSIRWSIHLCVLVFALHVLDRQIEYTSRLDYLWKNKLTVEREEVETTGSMNKVLLENILPAHVAEHFLLDALWKKDLYHEAYPSVCAMFASIPNFKDFYQQTYENKEGLECLRLLNEIIADFDQLLSKPKFSSVEKIKTIGSTYMAATGLHPGRESQKDDSKSEYYIICMTDFALALMATLESINKESFNHFRLRIGINHGPVVAGVIGAQKPQYDIWGDTVNVASRMDTFGRLGKIHCPEKTAEVLIRAGYRCDCCGPVKIKGKDEPIVTYVVSQSTKPTEEISQSRKPSDDISQSRKPSDDISQSKKPTDHMSPSTETTDDISHIILQTEL